LIRLIDELKTTAGWHGSGDHCRAVVAKLPETQHRAAVMIAGGELRLSATHPLPTPE